MMTRIEVRVPALHRNQLKLLAESRDSRYRVVACGRRWGKTYLCHELAAQPIVDGKPVGYFAPDYKRLSEYWESIKSLLLPITKEKSETLHKISCIGGGSLECWTLEDEDAGRSRKYQRVIIDEAGLVSNLQARWNEAIRPTLIDMRGDAWMLGTPKGRNYFWQCFERGMDPKYPRWQSWQMPSHANPYLSPDELVEIMEDLTERSQRQEILAEFVEDGGGVFRGVRAASVLEPGTYNPRHRYYAGIDWATGGEDFTVVSIWDAVTRQQVHMERWSGLSDKLNVERVSNLYDEWHWDDALAENNGVGKPLISWLNEESKADDDEDEDEKPSIPVRRWHTDNDSKRLIIERLAVGFERNAFQLLNDSVQIAEHEAFERKKTPGGLPKFEAPEGFHDDTVIANALAWELARHAAKEKPEPEPPRDDRMVGDLAGMAKFFHTKEKKGRWG